MKQLFVQRGKVVVEEVSPPPLDVRGILVETRAIAISTGTETSSLRNAQQSLLVQLAKSPVLRQKVIQGFKEGTLWSAAWQKLGLGAPTTPPQRSLGTPTGYSCAGRVLGVGERISGVQIGDRVACAGLPHAEIIYVPENLFVPIPKGVSDAEAAYVALGSIALHSVRQAELSCGETVVVMGLGIIGQFVEQLARISGARTIVTDPIGERRELARRMGAHLPLDPTSDDLLEQVMTFTEGLGADAILLCMGGNSPQPIHQALKLVRDRGRLVVVGTPRMDIPRSLFYQKEVELRIARSYGPGRYDPAYEEEGKDYPVGYVRWTEGRNMAEFLRLISENHIDVASLITHRFPFEQAPQAYEVALGGPQTTMGIVILREEKNPHITPLQGPPLPQRQLSVAVIGAGSFARAFHIPNIVHTKHLKLRAIVTSHRKRAKQVASEFGAEIACSDLEEVLRDPAIELVVIATPHQLHAAQTVVALEAGKAVLCEKPMGMTQAEVDKVVLAVENSGGFYAIGFNRRFAPTVVRTRELLAGRKGPLVLNYRVMGTFVPANHWIYDPERGGGRIIGEMCHFFDLLCYLVGSAPVHLTASGGTLSHAGTKLDDNVICTLTFADGSIASLVYGDMGQPQFPKERLEIFAGEGVLVLDDFRELRTYDFSGQRGMQLTGIDKGHKAELEAIAEAILHNQPSPVNAQAGYLAMRCVFSTLEVLRSGQAQKLQG